MSKIIKPEDMLDTSELTLEDVADALAGTKDVKEDIIEDDVEDEVVEDDEDAENNEEENDTEGTEDNSDEEEDDESNQQDEPEIDPENSTKAQLAAFASMKRAKKEAERTMQELNQQFAKLAKEAGFENVKSAKDYLDELRKQRYTDTNDPEILAEMVASRLAQPKQQNEEVDDLLGMVVEFNKEFGFNIKSVDDIASLPNAERVIDLLGATYTNSKGESESLSLKDAFVIANRDYVKPKEKKIRQEAVNKLKGHAHLKKEIKANKVETTPVTTSELRRWMEAFPEKTRSQAIKEIRNYKKQGHEI